MGLLGPPLLQVGLANPRLSLGMFNYFLKVSPPGDLGPLQGSPSQPLTSPANTTERGWACFYFFTKMLAWDFLSHLLSAFLFAVKGITIS